MPGELWTKAGPKYLLLLLRSLGEPIGAGALVMNPLP